ncbi:MAG TPA: hypothetical protein VND98_02170 [Solirubrobacterales bacterium]|nr:hypothetical protein [Solirubrobacterales bacterium]
MTGKTLAYEHPGGDRHRHGNGLSHSHHHDGPHTHSLSVARTYFTAFGTW